LVEAERGALALELVAHAHCGFIVTLLQCTEGECDMGAFASEKFRDQRSQSTIHDYDQVSVFAHGRWFGSYYFSVALPLL
jgi:hypothetical protein